MKRPSDKLLKEMTSEELSHEAAWHEREAAQLFDEVRDLREHVENYHGQEHQGQERHASLEDRNQLDLGRRDALQVIGRHRHGRRQERGLEVEGDQDSEEQGIDANVRHRDTER